MTRQQLADHILSPDALTDESVRLLAESVWALTHSPTTEAYALRRLRDIRSLNISFGKPENE